MYIFHIEMQKNINLSNNFGPPHIREYSEWGLSVCGNYCVWFIYLLTSPLGIKFQLVRTALHIKSTCRYWVLYYSYRALSEINISSNICTLWHSIYDVWELLYVSTRRYYTLRATYLDDIFSNVTALVQTVIYILHIIYKQQRIGNSSGLCYIF
jgi:hypothetical protein